MGGAHLGREPAIGPALHLRYCTIQIETFLFIFTLPTRALGRRKLASANLDDSNYVHTFQPLEAATHTSPYGGVTPFCVDDWGSEKYSSGAFDLPTEWLSCLFL